MGQAKIPSTCSTFLGFELDSIQGKIRLPHQKLGEIKSEVYWWLGRKSCMKRELESLVVHLCHTSRVVKPGKHSCDTGLRHRQEPNRLTNTSDWVLQSVKTYGGSTHSWQRGMEWAWSHTCGHQWQRFRQTCRACSGVGQYVQHCQGGYSFSGPKA